MPFLFGNYTVAVKALGDNHATKVQQMVALRLAGASRAFAERYAYLTDDQRAIELDPIDRLTMISRP